MYTSLWTERVSRLFFMFALASLDVAVSHLAELEKLSVMISSPRPGRISGVGALVDKVVNVGVADGGNQFMVAVGSGVSVAVNGVGVASIVSSWAQDVKIHVIARSECNERRSNLLMRVGLLCRGEHPPRNDGVGEVENIIFIW